MHPLSSLLTLSGLAAGASLQQVTSFGVNTSGTKMYIYVPDNLATNPAVIVAIHYCSGTANAYYTGTPYATLAEKHGFIVIYPESPYSGTCWDVSSTAALTHNGGADSNSIANMVAYTLDKCELFLGLICYCSGALGVSRFPFRPKLCFRSFEDQIRL